MATVIVRWCNNDKGFAEVDVVGGSETFHAVRFDPNGVKYQRGDQLSCTLTYTGGRMRMTEIHKISEGVPRGTKPSTTSAPQPSVRRGFVPMRTAPRRFQASRR